MKKAKKALSSSEVENALKNLPGWSVKENKLHREFKFKNFREAFAFMTQVAMWAEKMDHHPDWSNVYNQVVMDLMTHDAEGITEKDFELARKINSILS